MHRYWQDPDAANQPGQYLAGHASPRSRLLVEMIRRHVNEDASILEIGCNAGRNLKHLRDAGFGRLEAVEISRAAIALLRSTYPDLADVRVLNAPIEDVAPTLPDGGYDVVFTMAVLEHVHSDSDWVFRDLARAARRFVLTIEDERGRSERHFPRNYQQVFEGLGLRQVEHRANLVEHGLTASFVARVFAKP